MTGRELVQWILANKAEDKPFEVQYRDDGGDYSGTDTDLYLIEDIGSWLDENGRGWDYTRILL